MQANFRGRLRGYLSTLRAGASLLHPHLVRLALGAPREQLRAYADAAFKLYMESRCTGLEFLELGEAVGRLGLDPTVVQATLVDVGGYRGRSDWERLFLALAVRSQDAAPCFEIGTAAGNTTVQLASNTGQVVYTLDLADAADAQPTLTRLGSDDVVRASRVRAEFIRRNPRTNIVEMTGDSAAFDFTPFLGRIGLFFVDGAHSLEYVRHDSANAARCCRDDGLIVWDDFTTTREVTQFVMDLRRSGAEVFGLRGTRLAFSRDIGRLRGILA